MNHSNNTDNANALLFIHAHTSLHAGTGTALGTVDLPIQRERHTGWPMIAGSSIKGVTRDHCRPASRDNEEFQKWLAVFGPETDEAHLYAGALSLTDARILAFPVRSAKGVFAWVTCPATLTRLARDARLANFDIPIAADAFNRLAEGTALTVADSPLVIDEGGQRKLLLEEYDFTVDTQASDAAAVGKLADWLAQHAVSDEFTPARLSSHLVILPDTEFTHFVRHATEVAASIALEYETKTVSGGALFYEEFLPPETLLYAVVLANNSRRKVSENGNGKQKEVALAAPEVLAFVTSRLAGKSILQIGGNETIGKGLCAVRCSVRESDGTKGKP